MGIACVVFVLVHKQCFFYIQCFRWYHTDSVTRAVHNGDQMMERKKAEHISITSNNGDRTLIRKKEFLPKKCNSQLPVAVIGNSDRFESIPQWAQPCSSSERRDYNEVENVYGEIGTDNVLLPASQLQNIDAVNGGMAFNNSEIVSVCHSSPQDDFKAVGMASQSASSEPSSKMSASTLSAGQNFILRPKKRRHVYHEIILPFEHNKLVGNCKDFPAACIGNSKKAGSAPAIPFKPHYLRSEFTGDFPPPLPPRVLNKDAVLQRKHLTEEYFENIRKSMDIDLENDLVLNDLVLPAEASQIGNDEGAGPSRTSVFTENDTNPLPLFEGGSFTRVDHANSLHLHGFLMDNGKEIPYDSSIGKDVTNSVKSHCEAMSKHRIQFVESLKSLKHCGWYWGNMSWEDAETMLAHTPNQEGVFLVRDSQDPLHILTVTVRSMENTYHHIRIEHADGKFQLYEPSGTVSRGAEDCVRHPHIVSFINLAMKHSRSGTFSYFIKAKNMGEPPIQIKLLTPISRFSCVKSLKYCARFVIRELVPIESIQTLPIPLKLKEYLLQSQYFDPSEDYRCAQNS